MPEKFRNLSRRAPNIVTLLLPLNHRILEALCGTTSTWKCPNGILKYDFKHQYLGVQYQNKMESSSGTTSRILAVLLTPTCPRSPLPSKFCYPPFNSEETKARSSAKQETALLQRCVELANIRAVATAKSFRTRNPFYASR
jgi:hypothetical protein